ncbi:HET-domain-containing protein [Microthyrium microscopicum]|uniref:HET-domain-containing protein n=1 Tax=Microthyrium microscopicum TaxID=703497 RepID=A0A6A6UE42_9PEZI|nr:HET-domain-containing protein [Microthyrium microscopicum]
MSITINDTPALGVELVGNAASETYNTFNDSVHDISLEFRNSLSYCAFCRSINLESIRHGWLELPLERYLTTSHLSAKQLESQNGCGLCKLITPALPFRSRLNGLDTLFLRFYPYYDAVVVVASTRQFLQESCHLDLLCGPDGTKWLLDPNEDREYFTGIFLKVSCGLGNETVVLKSRLSKHRKTSSNAGSNECLTLASRWLEECVQAHSQVCDTSKGFVPNRLIDVGQGAAHDIVKLVSLQKTGHQDPSLSIKYAALSYCWGTTPFLTTTSLNVNDMYDSISISQLPATIQDAIKITRYMKIPYLWIDSLCILQGSDEAAQKDWESESPEMGQLYESAHVTIAAENAPSAVTGILHRRPKPVMNYAPIPIAEEASDVVYLGLFEFSNTAIDEPLHTRGWTLQETKKESRIDTQRSNSTVELHVLPESSTSQDRQIGIADDINSRWQSVVEDYSRRHLTKASDKLPAITGLIRIAQRTSGDYSTAGVWASTLPKGLLWRHTHNKSIYISKDEFRAPSWSWAAVEGLVNHLETDASTSEHLFTRIQLPRLSDTTGRPSWYKLVIKGWIKQMGTVRCSQFGTYHGGYDNFPPWMSLPSSLKTYLDDLNNIPRGHQKGGKQDPLELVNSYFLFLMNYSKEEEWPATGRQYFGAGLIVIPVGRISQYFRRIGMFEGLELSKQASREMQTDLGVIDHAKRFLRKPIDTIVTRTIALI